MPTPTLSADNSTPKNLEHSNTITRGNPMPPHLSQEIAKMAAIFRQLYHTALETDPVIQALNARIIRLETEFHEMIAQGRDPYTETFLTAEDNLKDARRELSAAERNVAARTEVEGAETVKAIQVARYRDLERKAFERALKREQERRARELEKGA